MVGDNVIEKSLVKVGDNTPTFRVFNPPNPLCGKCITPRAFNKTFTVTVLFPLSWLLTDSLHKCSLYFLT